MCDIIIILGKVARSCNGACCWKKAFIICLITKYILSIEISFVFKLDRSVRKTTTIQMRAGMSAVTSRGPDSKG